MRKWGQGICGLIVLVMLLTGCGSASNDAVRTNSDSASEAAVVTEMNGGAADQLGLEGSAVNSKSDSSADNKPAGNQAPEPAGGGGTAPPDADKAASGQGAGFAAGDASAAGLNKKLIYRANLSMEVKDYGKAEDEVRREVTQAGGYIVEFSENLSQREQGGTLVAKIPAAGFASFLDRLEQVEHASLRRNIQGQDVSEEYVDLEARLKAKELLESQYIEFMNKATKAADLVSFANELGQIQEEIERLKGRMRYIDQNVAFSTVQLDLYESEEMFAGDPAASGPLMQRAGDALSGSLRALWTGLQWLVVALAWLLPMLVTGAVVWLVARVFRRRMPRSPWKGDSKKTAGRNIHGPYGNGPYGTSGPAGRPTTGDPARPFASDVPPSAAPSPGGSPESSGSAPGLPVPAGTADGAGDPSGAGRPGEPGTGPGAGTGTAAGAGTPAGSGTAAGTDSPAEKRGSDQPGPLNGRDGEPPVKP